MTTKHSIIIRGEDAKWLKELIEKEHALAWEVAEDGSTVEIMDGGL